MFQSLANFGASALLYQYTNFYLSSVAQPHQPQRQLIARSILHIVGQHIGVWHTGNLPEALIASSYLKSISMVYHKVTLPFPIFHYMIHHQLAHRKRFPHGADLHLCSRYGIQQVARSLYRGAQRIDTIQRILFSKSRLGDIAGIERVADTHDEVVLVAVTQQRVGRCDGLQEAVHILRQVHVVDVKEVELVALATGCPVIPPGGTGYHTGVLGALLEVDREVEVGRCQQSAAYLVRDKREHEFREFQPQSAAQLGVVVVDDTLSRARDAFVCASHLGG